MAGMDIADANVAGLHADRTSERCWEVVGVRKQRAVQVDLDLSFQVEKVFRTLENNNNLTGWFCGLTDNWSTSIDFCFHRFAHERVTCDETYVI